MMTATINLHRYLIQGLLSGDINLDGYPEASTLTFDSVTVLGQTSSVSSVFINGNQHTEFQYDDDTKVLL